MTNVNRNTYVKKGVTTNDIYIRQVDNGRVYTIVIKEEEIPVLTQAIMEELGGKRKRTKRR